MRFIHLKSILFFLCGALLHADGFISPASLAYTSRHPTLPNKNHIVDPRKKNHLEIFAHDGRKSVIDQRKKVLDFPNSEIVKAKFEFEAINSSLNHLKLKEEQVREMLDEAAKELEEFQKMEIEKKSERSNRSLLNARLQREYNLNFAPKKSTMDDTLEFVDDEKKSEGIENYSVEVDRFGITHLVRETLPIKKENITLNNNTGSLREIIAKSTPLTKSKTADETARIGKNDTSRTSSFDRYQLQRALLDTRLKMEKKQIQEQGDIFESSSVPDYEPNHKTLHTLNSKTRVETDSFGIAHIVGEAPTAIEEGLMLTKKTKELILEDKSLMKDMVSSEMTQIVEQDSSMIETLDPYLFQKSLLEARFQMESSAKEPRLENEEGEFEGKTEVNSFNAGEDQVSDQKTLTPSYIGIKVEMEDRISKKTEAPRELTLKSTPLMRAKVADEARRIVENGVSKTSDSDSYLLQRSLLEARLKMERKETQEKEKIFEPSAIVSNMKESTLENIPLMEDMTPNETTPIMEKDANRVETSDSYLFQRALLEARFKMENNARGTRLENEYREFEGKTGDPSNTGRDLVSNQKILQPSHSDIKIKMGDLASNKNTKILRELILKSTPLTKAKAADEAARIVENGLSKTSNFDPYLFQKALLEARLKMETRNNEENDIQKTVLISKRSVEETLQKSELSRNEKKVSKISENIIKTFTPDEGVGLLKNKEDTEILGFLFSRVFRGFVNGGKALWFGSRAVSGDETKLETISAVVDSTQSFVSVLPAVAALGLKQGERMQKFVEKVSLENSRKQEQTKEISDEKKVKEFLAKGKEELKDLEEIIMESKQQRTEARIVLAQEKETSKASTTQTEQLSKILHFIR